LLIEAGVLAPQSKLPPERAVGDAFGITRMTIRQALFQLEAEGLIYRQNRRGWFVSPPRLRYDPTANLSFTENARAYNLANFMRTLTLPKDVEHWSLTSLRESWSRSGRKSCDMAVMSPFNSRKSLSPEFCSLRFCA